MMERLRRKEDNPMRRISRFAFIIALLLPLLSRTGAIQPVYAEPYSEETRKLLEKSLSVVEIDREIKRIEGLQSATQTEIKQTEDRLTRQQFAIAAAREKAGRVLRSYYMGYKNMWLSAALSADSLPELIRVLEWMDLIMESDRNTMTRYRNEYADLRKGYDKLHRDEKNLADVRNQLVSQRDRIAALQKEVDDALAASGNGPELQRLMDELQAYWKNVGLSEVKKQFGALADAMEQLPEWIQKTPGVLKTNGLKARLTLTDRQLNEYLRSKDSRFDHFEIKFLDGSMRIAGTSGNMSVEVAGNYTVEDEPENAIQFHVTELIFNGLALPDTTRADLEREFDLGFYPQQMIKYVKAKSVKLETGKLTVDLAIG
jgi:peptidoglycan hydrolase CwlO-like protein